MLNSSKFSQVLHILSYLDPTKARDAFYTRENEIKQIESLIPEIREKIADTKDMKTETFKKLGDKRLMEEGIAAAFGSAEAGSHNGEGTFMLSIFLQNLSDHTNIHHQVINYVLIFMLYFRLIKSSIYHFIQPN